MTLDSQAASQSIMHLQGSTHYVRNKWLPIEIVWNVNRLPNISIEIKQIGLCIYRESFKRYVPQMGDDWQTQNFKTLPHIITIWKPKMRLLA